MKRATLAPCLLSVLVVTSCGGTSNVADPRGPIVFSDSSNGAYRVLVADEGSKVRLLTGIVGADEPALSRQDVVAFTAGGAMYRIEVDGTGQRRLTPDGLYASEPSWSPDGNTILFDGGEFGGEGELYLIGDDGSGLRRLTNTAEGECAYAWSADGGEVFFARTHGEGFDLYSVKTDGSDERKLTQTPLAVLPVEWSPDRDRLLAYRELDDPGNDPVPFGNAEIYLVDSDGANLRNLTQHDAWDSDATWSPDGQHIAFISDRSGTDDLYLTQDSGDGVTQLTRGVDASSPAWSSDGAQIAFGGTLEPLRVADVEGSSVRAFARGSYIAESLNWGRTRTSCPR
jgi:Tol biopolymer transport system component